MRKAYSHGPNIYGTRPCYTCESEPQYVNTWNTEYKVKPNHSEKTFNLRNNLPYNRQWGRSRYAYPANSDELVSGYNQQPRYDPAAKWPTNYVFLPYRDEIKYESVDYSYHPQ